MRVKCLVDCEQSVFCSKIRRENERDFVRDIRAASGFSSKRETACSLVSCSGILST